MKLKHLESALSSMEYQFDNPRIEYEQYATSPHLAASVALAAYQRGDLGGDGNKVVLDLGCGTGMLSLASACLGASHIVAVDIDAMAIQQAKRNVDRLMIDFDNVTVDFIQAELKYVPSTTTTTTTPRRHKNNKRNPCFTKTNTKTNTTSSKTYSSDTSTYNTMDDGIPLNSNSVDTVLINPPFGTKNNAGLDVAFLKAGCRLARTAVYSFHKSSTRDFLRKKIQNEWKFQAEVIAQMKFDIPHMYKFHTQKEVDIIVDLWRVSILPNLPSFATAICEPLSSIDNPSSKSDEDCSTT